MCTSCQLPTVPAGDDIDAFGERFLDILNHGALATMLSIGHRTGLFDAMEGLPPSTSAQIAEAAGLDERYVREWLSAMVTGRIIDYDPESRKYDLPPAHAACLTRSAAPNNLAVFAQYVPLLGTVEDAIVGCFENGGGVPYSEYGRFQSVMAEDSGQTVLPVLLDEILALEPGLKQRLESGIEVLDLGFGLGKALILMAQEFPRSRFTGYEISEEGVAHARARAKALGLANTRFEVRDATHLEDVDRFDLICTFDAIHDQADPARVLGNLRRALRTDGVYLMQDIDASSRLEGNLDHPLGTLLYTISCMHCMTVSLAQGGAGLGTMWGVELAEQMLRDAGFRSIEVHRLTHDVQNAYFVIRK